MDERDAYIALNMMERVGPVGVRSLVSVLGSAAGIFSASRAELVRADGIGPDGADAIVRQRDSVDWQSEVCRASDKGIEIITQIDEPYPAALKEIHDPPLALYVSGKLESRDKNGIGVVGTRRPTHYGRSMAERFGYQLGKAGFVVISGLAAGVDTAAHKGAIKSKSRTIAVIGSGLEHVYPTSNRGLAEEIAGHGAVVSEFPLDRQPDKTTFPMRNRIVSGLSMGVLVIEAGVSSGALITANQALDQGRSVFAMPGRVDSFASRGTHRLIKNGARLAEDVEDVLREFEFLLPPPPPGSAPGGGEDDRVRDLTEEETRLVGLLDDGPADVDQLIRLSRLRPAAVSALLIGLEMKKIVRMLPGRIVERRRG